MGRRLPKGHSDAACNSAAGDGHWSDPLGDSAGSQVISPNARYLQWKAEFAAGGGQSPLLDSVTAAYLPQNTPPAVKSIGVTAQQGLGAGAAAAKPAATQSPGASYSITVTDTGEAGPSTSAGTPTQTLGARQHVECRSPRRRGPGWRQTGHALHFRERTNRRKLVKATPESTFTDGDVLADLAGNFSV
jgi:hypothetical protein